MSHRVLSAHYCKPQTFYSPNSHSFIHSSCCSSEMQSIYKMQSYTKYNKHYATCNKIVFTPHAEWLQSYVKFSCVIFAYLTQAHLYLNNQKVQALHSVTKIISLIANKTLGTECHLFWFEETVFIISKYFSIITLTV
jgi:hypothetical protein